MPATLFPLLGKNQKSITSVLFSYSSIRKLNTSNLSYILFTPYVDKLVNTKHFIVTKHCKHRDFMLNPEQANLQHP